METATSVPLFIKGKKFSPSFAEGGNRDFLFFVGKQPFRTKNHRIKLLEVYLT
jgi:hypothetical protein